MKCACKLASLLLFAVTLSAAVPAVAQDYPTRPITMIVPYPPGGATDTIARIIQDSMSQKLGQQIIIENIGGAGGMIAAGRAVHAAPDGYTIMLHQVALAAGPAMYPKLAFDVEKDFVTIGLVNTAGTALAARGDLPPNNINELIRWLKEPGRNTKMAHAGVGSFGHLAGVLVAEELGVTVTQVPYRGAGPALNDLIPGRVDVMFNNTGAVLPLIAGGKLRALGVTSQKRLAELPDVPPISEAGVPGFDVTGWYALFVPARTPEPVIRKMHADTVKAVTDPDTKAKLEQLGVGVVGSSPEELRAFLAAEMAKWGTIIAEAGIKVE